MNVPGRDAQQQALHLSLARIDRDLAAEPHNPRRWIERAHCLLALRREGEAREAAALAQRHITEDAALWDAIGGLLMRCNDAQGALFAYDRAVTIAPDNAAFLFNRAAMRRIAGRLSEAERDLDRVIELHPAEYEAYQIRADLRIQTVERNHIADLEALLLQPPADWRAEVQVRYALAKEYEDLADYQKSFSHLERGAARRRAQLRYDVAADAATIDWIIDAFAAGPPPGAPTPGGPAPIFIVGLPRSGTTLTDRILSAHSALRSAGESNEFALCLVDAVRAATGAANIARRELVARSAEVDFPALGRNYLARVQSAGGTARFIDKMPLNYLYCGLIRRALPNAKIVHLTRHPLAACYAMYKTLFKDGYPFSYDLGEIGRYYIAYRKLMDHWKSTMPSVIHEVRYEALVTDQWAQTRQLLEFCGLPWEEACMSFHLNPAPTATASAAQVRREIYRTSLDQWRHYASRLGTLRSELQAAGIDAA